MRERMACKLLRLSTTPYYVGHASYRQYSVASIYCMMTPNHSNTEFIVGKNQ